MVKKRWIDATILGMLIAVGPIGIDMYLPAFPIIANSLHTSVGLVQLSLVSYFCALAGGQLIYGPLSDRFGRRLPLLAGMILYTLAAIVICLVHDIWVLIGLRFLQGLGGCSGTVIARSIIRDVASGHDAAKLFSQMILVFGLAPILAPSIGSLLMIRFHWESIFLFMIAYGCIIVAIVQWILKETLPKKQRTLHLRYAYEAYFGLLKDSQYLLTIVLAGCMQAAFFAYLAGSPYDFIQLHHITPLQYGMLFGMNSIALIGASQSNARMMKRLGPLRLLLVCSGVAALAASALALITMLHMDSLAGTIVLLLVIIAAQGLITPTATMLALEPYPHMAGAASAMMGMALYAFGAIAGALVSIFFNHTSGPMVLTILTATCLAAILSVKRLQSGS